MSIEVFQIGRPMGHSALLPSVMWAQLDQMVVSVGPYMFHSAPTRGTSHWASSGDKASPPTSALSPALPCQPLARNSRQVEGVACSMVMPPASMSCCNALPSSAVARSASQTRAPNDSGRNSSSTEMSNA